MDRLDQLKHLDIVSKNRIAAMWVSKQRHEGMKTLDIMFELDDFYLNAYNENRIKLGFNASQTLALEKVFDLIYK